MTDPVSDRQITEAALALAESGIFSCNEGWEHMTCPEVIAIETFLRAIGADAVADDLIESHAGGDDDEDDAHHALYLEGLR